MTGLKIQNINDSCVTVIGKSGSNTISGRSPARLSNVATKETIVKEPQGEKEIIEKIDKLNKQIDQLKIQKSNPSIVPILDRENETERKSYKDKMNNIKVPDVQPFTTAQLALLNDIPIPYAGAWIKKHCIESGKSEKIEGQRGRQTILYKMS